MATDPVSGTIGTTAALSTGTGAFAFAALAMAGINPSSLGAALAACVVVQCLLPPENPHWVNIFPVTLGSMLLASFLAPWVSPSLASIAPKSMTPQHIDACAAALVAAFPKPIVLALRSLFRAGLKKAFGVTDADIA